MARFPTRFLFFIIASFAVLKAQAQSVPISASGANTYCAVASPGFIGLSRNDSVVLHWESSTNGGATWTNIGNPTFSQSYLNLTQTTCYRAIVQNRAFTPDSSAMACITIDAPSAGGTVTGGGVFCGGSGPGTLNLSGNTGNVLYWQYSINGGSSWVTVANTTTTLNHSNITQNTIYWAVVQNGSVCPRDTSSQVSILVDPLTVAGNISSSDTVCYAVNGGTLTLTGNVGNVLSWAYSINNINWFPIANTTTSQSYSGLVQTTWYTAVVKSGICAADTATGVNIKVWPLNPVNAGNDTIITQGQSFTLTGSANGTPVWSPATGLNNSNIYTPIATPLISTNYVLTVIDSNGCSNTDAVFITVDALDFKGIVSNLFTPNGDGINDTWYIQDIQNYPDNEVFVYNIYGNEVYSQKSYTNDWLGTYNGTALPDGTYYYVIKFNDSDQIIKGSVDIIKSK
ncbi:MAG: gliding motility-associated C-terminal domain-containing protein [Bacteroidota bacterium]